MIDFLRTFWVAITAPLSWLPPFAQALLVIVGAVFCLAVVASIIAAIVKLIVGIWELIPTN